MKPSLYFLRSSESCVLKTVAHYAFRMDETGLAIPDRPELNVHLDRYGMTDRDFGIYVTGTEHKIIGAAWIRLHQPGTKVNGFIDEHTPILNMAVVPEARGQGIGGTMISQLLMEASPIYPQVSVSVVKDHSVVDFYKSFGFTEVEGVTEISPIDGQETITMVCDLTVLQQHRPPQGPDTSKWMG